MQYVVALIQHCKYLSNNYYLTIFTEPEENTCFSIIIINTKTSIFLRLCEYCQVIIVKMNIGPAKKLMNTHKLKVGLTE